ncbi:inositol 2-dehydrogenase-like [Arctopsyche grandis]|uniref:inositol 2-dehydrogenase-like n=1 Tax=Arctopsyche grandis TaxID=121162 RepID=UPI00406DA401
MATSGFKDTLSPYNQPKQIPPYQDYLYKQYETDVSLDLSKKDCEKPIGVAIFGLGRAGSIHLSNLVKNPRVQLLYVVDDIPSKWHKMKAYWGLKSTMFLTSKDAAKVYSDVKVDAVVVASPTFTHEDIVTKSLAAKKSVFCEKPIAEDIESSTRCYKQAEMVNKPLFSAFNRRFDPSYSALRDRVRAGEVGHVQMIKVCSRDSPLPSIDYLKMSGGIFHDCIVHDIDMATWVIGELPTKVQTTAFSHIPEIKAINDFDTVAILLTFPSGTIAMLDNSRHSNYGYDQRLEVFGSKGMIRADNERPVHCNEVQLGYSGSSFAPIWFSFPSRYRMAYYLEMEHFLDVVRGYAKPMVQGFQTIAVSKIATAAEKSARTGMTVELKWTEEERNRKYS